MPKCKNICKHSQSSNWVSANHDYCCTNNNPSEKQLSVSSISSKGVQLVWSYPTVDAPLESVSQNILIKNGICYFANAFKPGVYAKKVSDGTDVWVNPNSGPSYASMVIHQNVLYLVTSGPKLTVQALDLNTGIQLWESLSVVSDEVGPADNVFFEPYGGIVYVDGKILVPVAANGGISVCANEGGNKARGLITAVNSSNGNIEWTFRTTDFAKGEGGGVALFESIAIDEKKKLMFFGTGEYTGAPSIPKNYNDYRCTSLFAVDYRSGKYKWSFPFVGLDIWDAQNLSQPWVLDADIATPNLFTIRDKCGNKKYVVGANTKAGDYKVFDRQTGCLIWQSPFADPRLIHKEYPLHTFSVWGTSACAVEGDYIYGVCRLQPQPSQIHPCPEGSDCKACTETDPNVSYCEQCPEPIGYPQNIPSSTNGLIVAEQAFCCGYGIALDVTFQVVPVTALGYPKPDKPMSVFYIGKVNKHTGELVLTSRSFLGSVTLGITVANGVLYVPNPDGRVHIVDTATLTEIIPPIVLPPGSSIQSQVTISDGYIVVPNLPGAYFVPQVPGKGVFVYKLNP